MTPLQVQKTIRTLISYYQWTAKHSTLIPYNHYHRIISSALQDHLLTVMQNHHAYQCFRINSHIWTTDKITPVPTDMECIVTAPPTSRTCPSPPPRASKGTNSRETTADQCKKPTQVHPNPKPARKTPLLPTPTVPAQQHRPRTLISRPPQCNINRYQHNPCIPGPHTARFTRQ